MTTHTKDQLLQMNASPTLGFNWIKNIDNISNNTLAKIYPTGDACMMSGRIYIALPATLELTREIKTKYNIWL